MPERAGATDRPSRARAFSRELALTQGRAQIQEHVSLHGRNRAVERLVHGPSDLEELNALVRYQIPNADAAPEEESRPVRRERDRDRAGDVEGDRLPMGGNLRPQLACDQQVA